MKYVYVQYLRAVAALGVVIAHLYLQIEKTNYEGYWPHFLNAGVDLFFVISGFIMWTTTSNRSMMPGEFYWRRALRIVPLYWILTTVILIISLLVPSALQRGVFDPYHAVASYFFLPVTHPVLSRTYPLLPAGWTLNYEMLFYLIFGLCLLIPVAQRLVVLVCTLLAIAIFGAVYDTGMVSIEFWTSTIILEFAFGALIGRAYQNHFQLPMAVCFALITAGVLLLNIFWRDYLENSRFLVAGIPTAMIFCGVIYLEKGYPLRHVRWLSGIGDSSYSLYLSHGIVLSAVGQAWRMLGLGEILGLPLFIAISITLAIATGLVIYRFVERPLINAQRFQNTKKRTPTVA
jgi:exopolysaccharide production protein ExoZ